MPSALSRGFSDLPQRLSIRRVEKAPEPSQEELDESAYPRVELLDSDVIDHNEYDYIFKIILVGDSGVGKSNLLSRFAHNVFNAEERSTIGVDMMTKHVRIHEKNGSVTARLQIWDSAGQERFRAMASVFFRNTSAALLVYDITDRQSFASIPRWLKEIRQYSKDANVLLVGNKCDLLHIRTVTKDMGADFAAEHDLMFHETSAFDCTNVLPAFVDLVKKTFIQFEEQQKHELELKRSMTTDTDSLDILNDEAGDEMGPARDRSRLRAAARAVTQPLLKVKHLSTIILEDDDATQVVQHRKQRRSKCCKKG